jgi:uncharacterized NAD-dependent epimerase/dehydratase family protein
VPHSPRIIVLTEGHTKPLRAKTATSVIRYRGDDVIAVLDSTQAGKTAGELLGVGGMTPVVGSLEEAPDADTLLIGIAPSGGKIPAAWRTTIAAAISRGMQILSGLHEFLSDDAEFSQLAEKHGARLDDIRRNDERDVADGRGFREGCLRIQTIGNDCCVGKMVAAIEAARALQAAGHDAKFVATGQTGILIAGEGCPVDCVVSDFLNGAVEKLTRANEAHDILLIEGQGSLAHPRYSPVTLGLLHGARPQGLILCYEAQRPQVHGMPDVELLPLAQIKAIYEQAAALVSPTQVIAAAVNTYRLSDDESTQEIHRVEQELGIPACDVYRHGADKLTAAILALRETMMVASESS